MKPFHSLYEEANGLGTHHSSAGNEMISLRSSLIYSRNWKTGSAWGKEKNTILRLKNVIFKYWSLLSFEHSLCDAGRITLKFSLLNSDCLALIFWKSRFSEITETNLQKGWEARRSQLPICFCYKKCKVFWNVWGLRHLILNW